MIHKIIIFALLHLVMFEVVILAQTSQCIFSGDVRVNGESPPAGTVINLLRKDMTLIRMANYNSSTGKYGVNAFNSDGLQDGDSVFFQVISTTSYIAKTYGDPPVFYGKILPNPPNIFTVNLSYLDKPELLYPSNNETNQSVDLIFKWRGIKSADSYNLQIAEDSKFSVNFKDTTIIQDTSAYVIGLKHDKQFYWRVQAINSFGSSDWSDIFSFSTIIDKPSVPEIISPKDTTVLNPVVFSWKHSLRYDIYYIEISNNNFASILYSDSTQNNFYQLSSNLPLGDYWWRIRARNIAGFSDYSPTAMFSVSDIPQKPFLINPSNNALNLSTTVSFLWTKPILTEKFNFQLSPVSDFSTLIIDSLLLDSNIVIANLPNNSNFYWRVQAINSFGSSDWSDIFSFSTIIDKPSVPSLISPQNMQHYISPNEYLKWKRSKDAQFYTCIVSNDSLFQDTVLISINLSDTTKQLQNIKEGSKYWWKVKATNIGGESEFSDAWWFISILNRPDSIAITDASTSFIKIWWSDNSSNELGYVVERVDDSSNMHFNKVGTLPANSTVFIESVPLTNGPHYYRVYAYNDITVSYFSDTVFVNVTDNSDNNPIPNEYFISQNYPNPFNPSTKIKFGLPYESNVKIQVFNILGELSADLLNNSLSAGYHEIIFNANGMTSGIYFYSIQANSLDSKKSFTETKKLILLK